MKTKNIGDIIYHASAIGEITAYKIHKMTIESYPSNEGGLAIVYSADKRGNNFNMNYRQVFDSEQDARDYLLQEVDEEYAKKRQIVLDAAVNTSFIDTTDLLPHE